MSGFLFKYIGPATVDRVFSADDHFTMKCSIPKNFNDPYELFLTLDFNEEPDALAFYSEAIGQLPQLPTTCFSKSPAVVPMWAHYAQNLEGFAIGIDEERLQEAFPESGFGDVDYMDTPREDLTDMLYQAFVIGKPRYVHILQRAVFSSAYFTKTTCWSYENERRMVLDEREVKNVGDLLLMDVPNACLTSIISGPRASDELQQSLRGKADKVGCDFFEVKIGRSSATPYFLNREGSPHIADDGAFVPVSTYCQHCKEPTLSAVEECAWCQINDGHRWDAARRNPYRLLAKYGLLDSYVKGIRAIDRGIADRKK